MVFEGTMAVVVAKKHNLKFRELHVGVACQTHEQGL